MSKEHFSIPVTLNEKSFKDFIIFDTMKKQKRWKVPVALTVILFMLSTFCFASVETYPFLDTVGSILVIISVLIPTNYFRSFNASIKIQTEKMNLNSPRLVYTVNLSSSNILFFYPEEKNLAGQYLWQEIAGVWRTSTCIYLYVTPEQALLIPKNRDFDSIWSLITQKLDGSRIHVDKFF